MEYYNLDQIFRYVEDCLGRLQQSLTWKAEKSEAKNIIVIHNVAPNVGTPLNTSDSEEPSVIKVEVSKQETYERPSDPEEEYWEGEGEGRDYKEEYWEVSSDGDGDGDGDGLDEDMKRRDGEEEPDGGGDGPDGEVDSPDGLEVEGDGLVKKCPEKDFDRSETPLQKLEVESYLEYEKRPEKAKSQWSHSEISGDITKSESGRLICPHCLTTYKNRRQLLKHYKRRHLTASQGSSLSVPEKIDDGDGDRSSSLKLSTNGQLSIPPSAMWFKNRACLTKHGEVNSQQVDEPINNVADSAHTAVTKRVTDSEGYKEIKNVEQVKGFFHCPRCSLKFKTRSALRQHYRMLHWIQFCSKEQLIKYPELANAKVAENGHLICPCCSVTLRNNTSLINHYKTAHCDENDNATRREPMRRSFASLAFVKSSNEGIFLCPKCPLTFETRASLGDHFGEVHNDDYEYECPVCHVKFKTRSTALFHREMIHNDCTGDLQCHLCAMRFYSDSYLKRHIDANHGKGVNCRQCGAKFQTHLQLKEHKLVTHTNEGFHCGVCTQSFLTVRKLEIHFKTSHPDAEPTNVCEYCQKAFSAEQQLSYHVDEYHEHESQNLDKPFACPDDLCEKRFRIEYSLTQHALLHIPETQYRTKRKIKNVEKVDDQSPCPSCGKLMSSNSIDSHLKSCSSTPTGSALVKCTQCEKSFKTHTGLRSHQISRHLNIKYPCHVEGCGKFLRTRYALKHHIKIVHESNVRHQCNQCESSFKIRHDLTQHIKAVHEGKKARCSFCDRDFTRLSERNRHERQVHGRGKEVNA